MTTNIQDLPDALLTVQTPIAAHLYGLGMRTFHDACDFVWRLPYGRTSDRANWCLVLTENKGTCSTKHALLKALSLELMLDVALVVGIYAMSEANTPGVGEVLMRNGLSFIPEAHCYLKYNDIRVDLTRFQDASTEPITSFFVEYIISPDGIGQTKVQHHQDYIRAQYGAQAFAQIWRVREQCITALSQPASPP